MKIVSALLATALAVQTAMVTAEYHMKSVKVIHARAQGDTPVWDAEKEIFTSEFGETFEQKYRAALDTVNTASVEGSLMYVQAECIDVNVQSVRCERKNWVENMVFYEIDIVQTNETLAQFQETTPTHEYGPMLPMDGGRVTPLKEGGSEDDSESSLGSDEDDGGDFAIAVMPPDPRPMAVRPMADPLFAEENAEPVTPSKVQFSEEALMINGDEGRPIIGPFIGGEDKSTNVNAPYPGTYWFSFPNTAPFEKWADKTEEKRAKTRQGLCDYGVKPDGVKCTFTYKILGYIPIDDVVGITALKNDRNEYYKDYADFCNDGGVEFKWNSERNQLEESIDFWKDPRNSTANAERAQKLINAYNKQVVDFIEARRRLRAIDPYPRARMQPLPSITSLTNANPKCYENVEKCAKAQYGCKRVGFSQICTICSQADDACVKAPENFVFPKLGKASNSSSSSEGSETSEPTSEPTPEPTPSSAASVGLSLATVCASFLLSYFA